MIPTVFRLSSSIANRARCVSTSLNSCAGVNSTSPLVQNFRTSWPEPAPLKIKVNEHTIQQHLPERTVSDDVLRYEMTASYDQGSALFYSHMKMNPADFKVIVRVCLMLKYVFDI